jgi:signal peptidase II
MSRSGNGLNKGIPIALISSLIVFLDYFTKKTIESKVLLYESINVLPFLNIVHVENKGAAFSLLTNLGNNYFVAISIIAISVIIYYLSQLPKGLELFSLSMILGGAVGNLIDRLRIGKVVDFIDIYIGRWHWPAFNVADSALTVGIILFLLANIRRGKMSEEM